MITRVWEIVEIIAGVEGRIVAPADGAGSCALACAILGKECYSSDNSGMLAREAGTDKYVTVHCEDYIDTLRQVTSTDTVFISHCLIFCPDIVSLSLARTRKLIVYDKERVYAGCNKLVVVSKDFTTRCSYESFPQVGFRQGKWDPKIATFLADEFVGHGSFALYGKRSLSYLWYMHRLGLRPAVENRSTWTAEAFDTLRIEYGFEVVSSAEVHLVESMGHYSTKCLKIDLRCGYIGFEMPKCINGDSGGDVSAYLGEVIKFTGTITSSPRGFKNEVYLGCTYVYPRRLGKKANGEVVVQNVRGHESWQRVKIKFDGQRRPQ